MNRAVRNISRRKIRALLVIIALGFSMAIMISIPAGVMANQKEANSLAENLSNTITQTGQSINDTLSQIDCSLSPDFAGFGFQRSNASDSFTPGQFGQGMTPPDDFVFDQQFTFSSIASGLKVGEIPIPTRYHDEQHTLELFSPRALKFIVESWWQIVVYLLHKTKIYKSKIFV